MTKIIRTDLIYNISLLLIALSTIIGTASAGVNLIANGDFESGDTGFYSDYDKLPLYLGESRYNISTDPKLENGYFTSFGDHTSGSGLMMVVNGATLPGYMVWSQTVAVTPNTDYSYSVWIASVHTSSPAQLQFLIDGDVIGTFTVSPSPGIWQEFTTTWNSGSRSSVIIKIVDLNTDPMGNDFSLDDISFNAVNVLMFPTTLDVTLNPGESVTEAKTVNIQDVPSRADVIFSFDLTGSMGNITAAARANAIEVMNTLDATGVDINYGVMSYHDYPHSYDSYGYNATYGDATMGDYPYALNRSITDDRVSVSSAINDLTIHGGMDGPESYTRVFYESYADPNVGWRPGTKKILLNFGDAFPHDDNIYEGSIYPGTNSTGGDPGRDEIMFTADDLDLQTVLSQMAANNIILLEAHSGNNTRQRNLWDYWTGLTGGYRYKTNSTNFTAEVVDAITTILATPDVSNLHLQASSGYESWLVSSVPASYTGPTGTSVHFDILIRVPEGTPSGSYTFTISAIDSDNVSYGDQTVTIHVPELNMPPVAEAGGPYTTDENVSITINAYGSYDSSGGILTYAWNLSNGSIYNVAGPQITLTQRDGPRTRIIKLMITNDKGVSSTDTALLIVNNVNPVVNLGQDQTIVEGHVANFIATFSDVQPDMNRSTAQIDYGDGAIENVVANPNGTIQGSHTYANNGTYTVIVTVTDKDGGVGSDSAIVTVSSVLPVAEAGGPYTVDEGTFIIINASGSYDPSGNALTYAWDYNGDGIYEVPGFNLTRTPRDGPSTRIIGLQVSNGKGGVSTDTAIWNVNNVPPKVEAGPDQIVNEGDPVNFVASFSDVQLDMNKSTVQINFGDGTTEPVVANPNGIIQGSHTYVNNGTYTVTVTVTDKDGGIGSDSAIVTVNSVLPVAEAGGPYTVDEGITVTINATGSYDPSGNALTYAWDWNGDGIYEVPGFNLTRTPRDGPSARIIGVQVSNGKGGVSTDIAMWNVNNVPPKVEAGPDQTINEGDNANFAAGFSDVQLDMNKSTVQINYGDGTAENVVANPNGTIAGSHTYLNSGTYTVTVTVTDKDGEVGSDTATITVINVAPAVNAGSDKSINEGDTVSLSGSFTDPGTVDSHTIEWNFGDSLTSSVFGDGLTSPGSLTSSHVYADNGLYIANLKVSDKDGGIGEDSLQVTVNNVAPTIDSLSADPYLAQVGTAITGTGTFHDPGILDTFAAIWNWDDGKNTINLPADSVSTTDSHTYTTSGVYSISLQITDKDGGSDIENISQYIVVYDPDGGFVTGGGWINSPAGAYMPDPALTGKSNFGFVSRYQKGATIPTGETEFQFKVADLNFHSTSYDWLVVAGARAQYKGSGTINGIGNYGFMLTAIDGQVNGGGGTDKFRIRIWDKASGTMVYDNQHDATDDADPSTAIAGGSIVIHK